MCHTHPALGLQVIVEKAAKSDVADIDKKKYLVPADLTVGQVRRCVAAQPWAPAPRAGALLYSLFTSFESACPCPPKKPFSSLLASRCLALLH